MQHNKHVQNKKCTDLLAAVVEADLCNGCGTCVAICPSNLRMKLNQKGESMSLKRALSSIDVRSLEQKVIELTGQ